MEDMDTNAAQFESPHLIDYEDLLEHVILDDHELLYLDTYLREAFAIETA